ncbi:MAG: hypothetical protein J5770_07710 [Bacteroidaceae bacterium]|nr:hypothetical protein [Bacteroidaceae bacterium]
MNHKRLKEEGNETVTNCHQLKLRAADGKMRLKIQKTKHNDIAKHIGVDVRN